MLPFLFYFSVTLFVSDLLELMDRDTAASDVKGELQFVSTSTKQNKNMNYMNYMESCKNVDSVVSSQLMNFFLHIQKKKPTTR